MANNQKRLIVGISGASGISYGIRTLELLKKQNIESHLIMSKAAAVTAGLETEMKISEINALATEVHKVDDIGASVASGSFKTDGMLIVPCSVKTMSEINTGVTSNLLSRAADVTLKERRKLVLMVRETPLHLGHLRTMASLTEMGAIVAPPVPALYTKPSSLDEMIDQSVARILDLFDIEVDELKRWKSE
ncbi:UbiX family flavin prenyltransferase [Pseudemcibacter aquimaris]|uniref:UbiX family flavin prenyltransferase n=1 Tax=Pseudemcibacter aquimaris TaxID=2857064 RepID=UPI002011FB8C|nr:UbiX family flavin prenyltransferase [Pseudemcibacter aquimaris]MCC3861423.1 UbiX family flavin prenyltransferase [Pseudemcibacter aquimaris]WDU58193.1 UbiX family flavin prenyltransferase [Pseudemcibacter aquimaris]